MTAPDRPTQRIPVTIVNPERLIEAERTRHRRCGACHGDLSVCPHYQQFINGQKADEEPMKGDA